MLRTNGFSSPSPFEGLGIRLKKPEIQSLSPKPTTPTVIPPLTFPSETDLNQDQFTVSPEEVQKQPLNSPKEVPPPVLKRIESFQKTEIETIPGAEGPVELDPSKLKSGALKGALGRSLKPYTSPEGQVALQQHAESLKPLAETARAELGSETQTGAGIDPLAELRGLSPEELAIFAKEIHLPLEFIQKLLELSSADLSIMGLGMAAAPLARMVEQVVALKTACAKGDKTQIAKALLLLNVLARQLEAEHPQLAKTLLISLLIQKQDDMTGAIAKLLSRGRPDSEKALNQILSRYMGKALDGESKRDAGANATQRINDLIALIEMSDDPKKWDSLNAGRIIFELMLDHGADALTLLKDLEAAFHEKNPVKAVQLEALVLKGAFRVLKSPQGLNPELLGKLLELAAKADPAELAECLDSLPTDRLKAVIQAALKQGNPILSKLLQALGPDALPLVVKIATQAGDESLKNLTLQLLKQGDEGLALLLKHSRGPELEQVIKILTEQGEAGMAALAKSFSQLDEIDIQTLLKTAEKLDSAFPTKIMAAAEKAGDEIAVKLYRVQILGAPLTQAMKAFLLDSLKTGAELARFALRYLTDTSSVGKAAHLVDFLKTLVDHHYTQNLFGERGQAILQEIGKFLSLDDFTQAQLKIVLESDGPTNMAQKSEALVNIAKDLQKRFPSLKANALDPLIEKLSRLGGGMTNPLDEAKPVEAKPVEAKPLEAKPLEAKPVAAKPVDVKPVQAQEALGKAESELLEKARKMGVSGENLEKLKKMARKLGKEGIEGLSQFLDKVGCNAVNLAIESFDEMMKSALQVVSLAQFKAAVLTDASLQMLSEAIQGVSKVLKELGVSAATKIAPKVGAGLLKMIPALGAAVSGYDTVKMGKIAVTGSWGDVTYKDPNVRAMALLGATINGGDTALAVAEAFGVGNVGVAASIAMAVVSIGIEIAVDHYNKNPMPAEIAQKLRRGSALAALGGAITAPISGGGSLPLTAAIVKIYGAETLAKELKAMGAEGFDALKQLAGMGKEGATAALAVFKELALEGGALGLRALDELQKMGKAGAEALTEVVMAGGTQAKWALEKLRNMGSLGQEALKAMMQELWNQGEKGLEVLVELYNQSGLNELQAFVMEKLQTAWDNSSLSNGYAGIRSLASEMLAQAEKSGDAATAFVKEMLQIFDQTYAGGMVPDALYR